MWPIAQANLGTFPPDAGQYPGFIISGKGGVAAASVAGHAPWLQTTRLSVTGSGPFSHAGTSMRRAAACCWAPAGGGPEHGRGQPADPPFASTAAETYGAAELNTGR